MRWKVVTALTLIGCVPFAWADNGVTKEGWLVLFDGEEMNGWGHTGGGGFNLNVEEKCMQAVGKTGFTFFYDRKFKDFVLELEWRSSERKANSGVFIRFPKLPKIQFKDGKKRNGYWDAVEQGYEVQIYDPGPPVHRTGAIIHGGPCEKKAWKPVGEWNKMEVTAKGQQYTVKINGVLVNEFKGDRATEGYIGVQNHDRDTRTDFRNIRVKELK